MMEQEQAIFKSKDQFANLLETVQEAVKKGEPIDSVEKKLWYGLLNLGQCLLQEYVDQQGTGDFGSILNHEGKRLRRLEYLHKKRYVSVFGEISIVRTVYGTRESQKHEVMPLDARLNLPESDFSFLLQEWSQGFCVHDSYKQSSETIERILGIGQSVRSLEHMNRAMAQEVEAFRKIQPTPAAETEGSILVFTLDNKGVPMWQETAIEPFPRRVEDVVNELFRKEQAEKRPRPLNKRIQAELTRVIEGEEINGKDQIFGWLSEEETARNADGSKEMVLLMDGERTLWNRAETHELDAIGILDIFHVMERLWSAAYCFCPEGSEEAEAFVKTRLTRILEGQVGRVIGGLKQMQTKHRLRGSKKKQLDQVITYLKNNQDCMHYDYYLECGYPIGSGVVEGACRHLVKDRMERGGMRWRTEGAQSMLDLRAVYINGDWEAFQEHRIQQNVINLYPHRGMIQEQWNMAA